jgi:hypothetical protein
MIISSLRDINWPRTVGIDASPGVEGHNPTRGFETSGQIAGNTWLSAQAS